MDTIAFAFLILGGMFALLVAGMPVGFAMLGAGFVGSMAFVSPNAALSLLGQTAYESARSADFAVIPLFILMGSFANKAGLSDDMFRAFERWLGQLRGGLALAAIGTCGMFSAVSGSSVATAATMTHLALPQMQNRRYSDKLATGSIAAGGTLGVLIPPSIVMVIYGIVTETNIADLFLAGFLPGLLMVIAFLLTIMVIVRRNPEAGPRGLKTSALDKIKAFRDVWPMLVLIAVVIGGIYTGIFSSEEAAGIGAFGALVLAVALRRLSWLAFVECIVDTVRTTAMLFMIIIGAFLFKNFLVLSGITSDLGDFISALPLSPMGILLVIILIYLLLGCVLESIAMMVLTLPIFFPIIQSLGFDPVWFGILTVIVVELGLITPPVGMNIFVIAGMAPHIKIGTIFRGVAPFVVAQFVVLILVLIFPQIALWLPYSVRGF